MNLVALIVKITKKRYNMTKEELIDILTNDFDDLDDETEIQVLLSVEGEIYPLAIKKVIGNESEIYIEVSDTGLFQRSTFDMGGIV